MKLVEKVIKSPPATITPIPAEEYTPGKIKETLEKLATTDSLSEILDVVTEARRAGRVARIFLAVAFSQIVKKRLYENAGYNSASEFADKELGYAPSTFSFWKRIGDIIFEYDTAFIMGSLFYGKNILDDRFDLSKLYFLPDAYENHLGIKFRREPNKFGKDYVLKEHSFRDKFFTLSWRELREWAQTPPMRDITEKLPTRISEKEMKGITEKLKREEADTSPIEQCYQFDPIESVYRKKGPVNSESAKQCASLLTETNVLTKREHLPIPYLIKSSHLHRLLQTIENEEDRQFILDQYEFKDCRRPLELKTFCTRTKKERMHEIFIRSGYRNPEVTKLKPMYSYRSIGYLDAKPMNTISTDFYSL